MPIESSGAISLGTAAGTNRSISGELGGSEPHALSEYYRDGSYSDGISIPATETGIPAGNWNGYTYTDEIRFSDFYGVSGPETGSLATTWFTDNFGAGVPTSFRWGTQNITSGSSPSAGARLGFQNDQTNDRIALRYAGYKSSAATSYSFAYISYTGYATETFRAKCQYSATVGGTNSSNAENPSSSSPATNTYANMSTSTYSPEWRWEVSATSSLTTCTISASSGSAPSSANPYWTIANSTESDTLSGPSTTFGGTTTYGSGMSLSATYGTTQGPGGAGDFCIHEDMLVSTQNGQESIHTVKDSVSKIWAWNNETSTKELVDLLQINIVNHDNLYTVNNIKLTEDHVVYLEGFVKASVAPAKTLENYEVTAAQLAVGDKLMKEDGTLETVTSIEVLAEEHVTYTLKTTHGNFYANNYLVDSEI
jgi:hypothetical protein